MVGAHLSGPPLNGQLLALGARFDRAMTTAAAYRLYALDDCPPRGSVHSWRHSPARCHRRAGDRTAYIGARRRSTTWNGSRSPSWPPRRAARTVP
ncbi:allophanate hydrolase-related protein [Streptomyces exfoliatus]|uniref:allophanate hydrolase-related protein n=1 Tax=Streptomyces exfoliatus TaxID=1905 RepID=UPI003C2AFDD9